MFLQLTTLLFAIQWLGSPWQLGLWKGVFASVFFLGMIALSVLPAMFREWGNVKKRILLIALLQILCLILGVVLPGLGQVISIIYNLILMLLPVTFYKFIGTGFLLFFLWFINLNQILGNFLLIDPRGIWSGDLYFSMTDWVILGVFTVALIRTVYHIFISYPLFKKYESYDISYILDLAKSPDSSKLGKKFFGDMKQDFAPIFETISQEIQNSVKNSLVEMVNSSTTDIIDSIFESGEINPEDIKNRIKNDLTVKACASIKNIIDPIIQSKQKQIMSTIDKRFGGAIKLLLSNTQLDNEIFKHKEKITLIPIFAVSVIMIIISAFIQPSWRQQAIDDLHTGFTAISENDYITAKNIAVKYYNNDKILYTGDVFYLNGLVNEREIPQSAMEFFTSAAGWYDNHKSWISVNYHGDSYYHIAAIYLNETPSDYYKARNTIEKAVKIDPSNKDYRNLQAKITENLSIYEEQEKIGFFRRLWNNIRSKF